MTSSSWRVGEFESGGELGIDGTRKVDVVRTLGLRHGGASYDRVRTAPSKLA